MASTKRRLTIGEYPAMTLAQARSKALSVKRVAREGRDPSREQGVKSRAASIVSDLINRFALEHLKRNLKSGGNVEKLLRLHLEPRWGSREPRSLSRADLIALLEDVRVARRVEFRTATGVAGNRMRGGPGAAAELRKWTRALFQFAVDNDFIPSNPFKDVGNRDRQRQRDRVLKKEELGIVWRAAETLPYPAGPFVQLMMLTGDRRSEWANAKSEWLDPEIARLEIPGSAYKTGRTHIVPLSAQARAIVKRLPKQQFGPNIFSSTGGKRPISGFSKLKKRLDTVITQTHGKALPKWTFHDLRRSMATHMERIGVQPHIIEVCLGHTLKGIAAAYRHFEYLTEKTEALQGWADELVPRADGTRLEPDSR